MAIIVTIMILPFTMIISANFQYLSSLVWTLLFFFYHALVHCTGERTIGPKKQKEATFIEKVKSKVRRRRSGVMKAKSPTRKPGAFILRAPLRGKNAMHEVKKFSP